MASTKFIKKQFTCNIGDGLKTGVATCWAETLNYKYYILVMDDHLRQICETLTQSL